MVKIYLGSSRKLKVDESLLFRNAHIGGDIVRKKGHDDSQAERKQIRLERGHMETTELRTMSLLVVWGWSPELPITSMSLTTQTCVFDICAQHVPCHTFQTI